MSNFAELNAPTQDASGYWVVQVRDSVGMSYLFNDRIDIGNLMTNFPTDFFFEKESNCHEGASAYYALFGGRDYPYTLQWSIAIASEQLDGDTKPVINATKSEPMEFI